MIQSPTTMTPESPFRTDMEGVLTSTGTNSPRQLSNASKMDGIGPGRRRRASKTATESVLKRSASTPNVRSLSQGDIHNAMLNDKKRNKLGYHRTSVACGKSILPSNQNHDL